MQKRFYFLTLTVIIAFVGLTMTDATAQHVCGDANSDGRVNVSDAVYLINYVFTDGPAPNPNCCESDCLPTVTDIDGNTYFTVEIGGQCWMAQNLRVTHYRNGDPIPNVTDDAEWENITIGAYCNHDNDESNAAVFGRLYNWFAVEDSRNIAPEGWHVPTDEEWKQLEIALGMSQADADDVTWRGTDEGGKMKEAGTVFWQSPNVGATNQSGFTALPVGWRSSFGPFADIGYHVCYWSSTAFYSNSDAWTRLLTNGESRVYRMTDDMNYGFPVRCVKD